MRRRSGLAVSLLIAALAAGVFTALAIADTAPPGGTTTAQTVTGVTPTTTAVAATTTTVTTTVATTTAAATPLQAGVTIGGVEVGGLAPEDARTAVQNAVDRPVRLRYGRTTILIAPELLGVTAGIDRALSLAEVTDPGTPVPLHVGIRRARVASFVAKVVSRFSRQPVDAHLYLRHLKPVIRPSKPGTRFVLRPIVDEIVRSLARNERPTIRLKPTLIKPKVSDKSFASVIVIRRGSNRLYLYKRAKLDRVFNVATGQVTYLTPLGRFHIVVMWKNPWWYPPKSPWAKGEKPVPPGPGNPLGTRWMGISSPGVGIHGTPDAASIGYSVSHGCVRMRVPDAEWLFDHVDVGTTVFIVSA